MADNIAEYHFCCFRPSTPDYFILSAFFKTLALQQSSVFRSTHNCGLFRDVKYVNSFFPANLGSFCFNECVQMHRSGKSLSAGYFLFAFGFCSFLFLYTFCLKAFLQASYSLLLFLLLVRCLYLLRPFRFIRHFGRILSASTSSLLACGVSSSLFSLKAN